MRKLLILAAALLLVLVLGVLKHRQHSAVQPGPGVLAAEAPVQVDLDHGARLQKGDTTLATRAHFDITARVLSRKDYSWHVKEFPIPRREIETSSANMHMIPADPGVKRQLERVRTGQVIRLEGFL